MGSYTMGGGEKYALLLPLRLDGRLCGDTFSFFQFLNFLKRGDILSISQGIFLCFWSDSPHLGHGLFNSRSF
jgi:hypothetical protein